MRGIRLAEEISTTFAAIYRHCHPNYTVALGHQALRALQLAADGGATMQSIARTLGCAPNTGSELVQRLVAKGLARKVRRTGDERVVEVRPTPAGEQVLREQTGLDAGKLAACLDGLSEAEREMIRSGLLQLLGCVSRPS